VPRRLGEAPGRKRYNADQPAGRKRR